MKKIKEGKGQKGFTLIELLVVVGIMAALAAIIIPNVAKFVGVGQTQGAATEKDAVQTAMDAAIADNGFLTVTPETTGAGTLAKPFSQVTIGTANPGQGLLTYPVYLFGTTNPNDNSVSDYVRFDVAKYGPYTWTGTGLVSGPTP